MNDQNSEIVSTERKFLHDLASPLSAAALMSEILTEELEKKPDFSEQFELVKRLAADLEKMMKMITERQHLVKKLLGD